MSDETMSRLLDEMSSWDVPFNLSPFKVNEPLLDKRLLPWLRQVNAYVPMASLRIFTNGTALTDSVMDQLAALERVTHLWISLNSTDPVEYERLMRLPYERTAHNLDRLHARDDFPHPVMLSTVGFPNEDFRRSCYARWPNFSSMAIKRTEWLGKIEGQSTTVPRSPCARWFELSIAATGTVTLCCMDGEGQFPLGNINESTMLAVYNQPHLLERREKLLDRQAVYPCSTCTYG